MMQDRESSSKEMPEKLARSLDDALVKITEALKSIAVLHKESARAAAEKKKWYVLKHQGIHHLVPNMGVRAYCGWSVTPDAEMISPPPTMEEYEAIAQKFCPACEKVVRAIDKINQQLRKE